MLTLINHWFRRYFSNVDFLILIGALAFAVLIFATLGHILAPVFASIVIAYLLHWSVSSNNRRRFSRAITFNNAYSKFIHPGFARFFF